MHIRVDAAAPGSCLGLRVLHMLPSLCGLLFFLRIYMKRSQISRRLWDLLC